MVGFISRKYLGHLPFPKIGLSGVHALPLAAGINVGGHYKWHFFSLAVLLSLSSSLLILPEGVVVGF
jgi:hypothetical protein